MRKWQVYLTGVIFLFLVMTACSPTGANSNQEGQASSEETFEFSIMATLHAPEAPNEKVLKEMEKAANVKLDIQWVPNTSYQDRLSTAFATNTLPDAVFFGNQAIFNQFRDAMEDGQFWEIGPYLDEFENLSKLKDNILENTKVNGKLYALYQGVPLSRQGLIYRKDWADNLGLEAPKTTGDFLEMARAFTEDDPDQNGVDDTFGVADRSDLIYGAFKTVSSWFGTPNNWGEKDGQLLPEFMFDEYMQTMDFFKTMFENGYINQDFPVTSKTDQQEFLKNGTAGMYVGAIGDVGGLYTDAATINSGVEFDVQNQIKGPDGEFGIWSVPGYGSALMFPKRSVESEEELKQILAFFDKMMTPELSNLANWGIEGEHYEVVDGKALPVNNKELTDREVKPYLSILIGEAETRGSYELLRELEVVAKSAELIKDNENYLIDDPTIPLYSQTQIRDGARLQQLITDATYQYMIGQIDKTGFETAVEEWRSLGGDAIIEEYNASWQEMK